MAESDNEPYDQEKERSLKRPWYANNRLRTLFYAALVAGAVSQFFGYANDKDQVNRNRKNCQSIQDDRKDRANTVLETADRLRDSADRILGNSKKHIVPFDLTGTGLEKFKPLIIAQAKNDQVQAQLNYKRVDTIKDSIEDCTKVFPKIKLIPFT